MEANPILLQKMYKRIIVNLSRKTGRTLDECLQLFYQSLTYQLIRQGIGDMHCRGDAYLTDELLLEYGYEIE